VDADEWNERYGTAEFVWAVEPNRFVADELADLPPGRALDLACGEGRNAVWLAEQGWRVTAVDFAEAGLAKGELLARERGVEVEWVNADVTGWAPPRREFDLVVISYLQVPPDERRHALDLAASAVAGGGTLFVVGHHVRNLTEGTGGPQDASVLYSPSDLLADLDATGHAELIVERSETVSRHVEGADHPALDCLLRMRSCDPADREH
jgi:SAM-dependent methyltransferase